MQTLPNRSVNTFQSAGIRRSSLTGMRYPRSSSLYLPQNDQNDESRSHLLPNDPYLGERRTQTLGRTQHHSHTAAPSTSSRNMTNPLFDSATSLDQPWYRGYGQPVSLAPPQINLPDQPMDSTSVGYGTVREMQPTIRVPSTRSPGRTSAYSTGRRLDPGPAAPKRNWFGCTGPTCCEKDASPYSSPDDLASSNGWTQTEAQRPTQPWVICLLTVSAIFDLILMIVLTIVVFFLNCSHDGRFYMDRRIQSICTTLWSDWIPLHHRTFRCPALPPGHDETQLDSTNPLLHQYMSQLQPPRAPTTPAYGLPPSNYPGPMQPAPPPLQSRTLQGPHTLNGFAQPEAWDADLGIMPPPQLQPFRPEVSYGLTTTRLYGPSDEHTRSAWGRTGRDSWLNTNPTAPYSDVATSSIILGCIILPLVMIFVIEVAASCLTCCGPYVVGRQAKRTGQLRRMIGRLYRLLVTYVFGFLTVMLLALILQAAIGRLRPEFIKICRPSPNVCPRWAALLRSAGYGFDLNDPDTFSSDPQLLNFLAQESARRGFYLVPKTTTPAPGLRSSVYSDDGVLSRTDCTEKNVLRMKYARTSFPSLSASVAMYATIFLAAYITHTLRYLRRICFCIPLTLLLGSCLVNLLLGMGRVVYRKNWLEDVLAGWALGLIVAAYVLYRVLKKKKSDLRIVSNTDLQKTLHRIQHLLQTNQEYRQNEMKLMKYL